MLSFLIYGTTAAEVQGLDSIPRDQWPSTLPLLFYSYHIMAGLGTYFALLMIVAGFLLWRGSIYKTRWILWPILLSFPLPYIADTAGAGSDVFRVAFGGTKASWGAEAPGPFSIALQTSMTQRTESRRHALLRIPFGVRLVLQWLLHALDDRALASDPAGPGG